MRRAIHICIVTTVHPLDDVRVNRKLAATFRSVSFRVSWVGPGHAFFDHSNYSRDNIEFKLVSKKRNRFDRFLSGTHIRNLARTVKNVIIYYAPDPDAAPITIKFAKRNGANVIFDIHEIFHGPTIDRWLMGRQLKPI